jgi:hypothetical protein
MTELVGLLGNFMASVFVFETRYRILAIGVIIFIILSCLKSFIVLARETGSAVL